MTFGQPLWFLGGKDKSRAIVVFVLDLLGLSDAHAVATPVVSEEPGEADVVDGVLAKLDNGVPIGDGGKAGAASRTSGTRVSCTLPGSFLRDDDSTQTSSRSAAMAASGCDSRPGR